MLGFGLCKNHCNPGPLMKTEASVEINRPVAEVFEYTNDNVVEWSLICVEDEILEEKNGGGVGTTFRMVTEDRGKRMEFRGEVTRHEAPRVSAVQMVGDYFDIDVEYQFEGLPNGNTRVTQYSSVTGKGFFKIMLALTGWMMKKSSCKAQDNELGNLKRILESK